MRAGEIAAKCHLPGVRGRDYIVEAAGDKGYGGKIVWRQVGDGMNQNLCARSASIDIVTSCPSMMASLHTIRQLRDGRALVARLLVALDNLEEGPIGRLSR
jgi:hypothetical protein